MTKLGLSEAVHEQERIDAEKEIASARLQEQERELAERLAYISSLDIFPGSLEDYCRTYRPAELVPVPGRKKWILMAKYDWQYAVYFEDDRLDSRNAQYDWKKLRDDGVIGIVQAIQVPTKNDDNKIYRGLPIRSLRKSS